MRPKVKYHVIHDHNDKNPVAVMFKVLGVSRIGYYDFVKRLGRPEHDATLAEKINECQSITDKPSAYRRVWLWLEGVKIYGNPKRC